MRHHNFLIGQGIFAILISVQILSYIQKKISEIILNFIIPNNLTFETTKFGEMDVWGVA